jgi:hypothetical protein
MSRPYRPSNGTEGELFCEQFCYRCVHDVDENCPILAATLVYQVGDEGYPNEWVQDEGVPCCTAFLAIGDDVELAAARADARQTSLPL